MFDHIYFKDKEMRFKSIVGNLCTVAAPVTEEVKLSVPLNSEPPDVSTQETHRPPPPTTRPSVLSPSGTRKDGQCPLPETGCRRLSSLG